MVVNAVYFGLVLGNLLLIVGSLFLGPRLFRVGHAAAFVNAVAFLLMLILLLNLLLHEPSACRIPRRHKHPADPYRFHLDRGSRAAGDSPLANATALRQYAKTLDNHEPPADKLPRPYLVPAAAQFKAEMLTSAAPTTKEGIEKYLGSGMVKGIGPVYAKKLVEKFGEKIFEIIEQESARLEDIDGIGPKRRQRIKEAWAEQKVRAALTSGWAKKSTKAASSACPKPVGNRSRASQNCSMAGEAISTATLTIRWRNGPSCVIDYLPVKNGVRPCWEVCTSVVRSRYLLPWSQEVSGENRQAWQAAPCKDRPSR